MAEIIVGVVVGLLTGVASSFGVWWFLSHAATANLRLAPQLAHAGPGDYRVRLANVGSRAALEVRLVVQLWIPNLEAGTPRSVIYLKDLFLPVLPPNTYSWHSVRTDTMPTEVFQMYGDLLPGDLVSSWRSAAPTDFGPVFDLDPDGGVSIRIFAFGTDQFSGSRVAVDTEIFRGDVREGVFAKDSLEIDPPVEVNDI